MKKALSIFILCAVLAALFSGCGQAPAPAAKESGKLSVVATIFPAYDFAREIVGSAGTVTMLVPPGSEIHSYEPTPQDILTIQNCDIFIYNGGDSDEWVDDVLSSVGNGMTVVRMTDCVAQVQEEDKEGMTVHEEGSGGPEYDEHVWTSPVNAQKIAAAIAAAAEARDAADAGIFQKNLAAYTARLKKLDEAYREVVANAKSKTLIFADRFPVRYFTEEYGLDYYAAYPGCAEDAEPSAKTVAFLIDKVRQGGVPYVLYIEFSNQKMADTVCEDTGCGKLEFNSCHNVSKADFESGVSYLDLMWANVDTVRKALG
ncbi:MAG TPA: metal ABC transporter substrate-binding protein [Oscillospiraceae bacterium]|nr:metal ABC transporter substrate-binding protein [Oscillospiraceae bacterium]HPS75122.1 metal ABC transporter substrate-binding protein [Oscillospiraceae bacterium]